MLDTRDCNILSHLQQDGRMSFAELGRAVGLSTPAVIERVRRLEASGVILGYHAHVNPAMVGLPVAAIIRITVDGHRLQQFGEHVKKIPEVLECHRVTGTESYLAHVAVRDTQHLEEVIDLLMPYVQTNTSLVLASPVAWKKVTPGQSLPRRTARRRSTRPGSTARSPDAR